MACWTALGLAGCTSGTERERPPRPSVRPGEFGKADCFDRSAVLDFEVLDDRNLIVFGPRRSDAYHVHVTPPESQLRWVNAIGFETSGFRVCGYAGDSLIVPGASTGRSRLSVNGVYRLDPAELAGLEGRFGMGKKPPGAAPAAPQPQPGEGATIERDIDKEHKE